MDATYRVTSVGERPEEERSHRTRNYLIAMAVRMVCILALLFVQGWFWMLLFALGAVFLPYFAVILANVKSSVQEPAPDAVTPLELGSARSEREPSQPAENCPPEHAKESAAGQDGRAPSSEAQQARPADVLFVVDAQDVPTVSERMPGDRRFTADQHGGVSDPHTASESHAPSEPSPHGTVSGDEPSSAQNLNNGDPKSC